MIPSAYPSIRVRFACGSLTDETWALVDTGFDGALAIPASLVRSLPPPLHTEPIVTASGDVVAVPVYAGTVDLLDQPRSRLILIIALGDEYLIGIDVLNHYRVTFDHGQQVIVEP